MERVDGALERVTRREHCVIVHPVTEAIERYVVIRCKGRACIANRDGILGQLRNVGRNAANCLGSTIGDGHSFAQMQEIVSVALQRSGFHALGSDELKVFGDRERTVPVCDDPRIVDTVAARGYKQGCAADQHVVPGGAERGVWALFWRL
eukprot:6590034-Prymnesium_polylepis.1